MQVNKNLVDYLYSGISTVELETLVTSISVKELRKANASKTTISKLLASIDNQNASIEADNLNKLSACFADSFRSAPFMATEKYLFLRVFAKVRKATNNFTITFQSEADTNTIGNTESGLTPYRKTTISAAGLRTCFNSYDIFRDEVARTARKQANEKQLQRASASLAASLGIDSSLLTPELLAKFGFTRVCKVD